MKIDRDAKTPMETGELVQPDSQTTPRTVNDERAAHKQADRLSGLSGSLPDEIEVEMLLVKVRQLPETRPEKVASIKSAIQEGNYRVSPEQTADTIISEMESRAERRNPCNEGRADMAVPNNTRPGPVAPPSEPLTLCSQQISGSRRRRRGAPPASRDDEFREASEASSELMEGSG